VVKEEAAQKRRMLSLPFSLQTRLFLECAWKDSNLRHRV
jgi:hypothetical protein